MMKTETRMGERNSFVINHALRVFFIASVLSSVVTQLNTLVPNHLNGKLGFGAPYKNVMCDVIPLSENLDTDMTAVYDKFAVKEG